MKFREYSVNFQNYSVVTDQNHNFQAKGAIKYKPFLIVNLLPAHPYQYPLHQYIKEYLTNTSLNNIKKAYNLQEIVFILNSRTEFFYGHIIKDLNCRVIFREPEYPFLFNLERRFPGEESQLVNWFDFIVMSMACAGREISKIPVALTIFNEKNREKSVKYYNIKAGSSISDILKKSELSEDHRILTDHPFKGNILSPDMIFTEIRPVEILIFPKKNMKHRSGLKILFSNFIRNSKTFSEIYNVSENYKDNPCQKCLHCSAICPAALYPFMLSAISEKGNLKDAVQLNLTDCIECGLCNYVCPSDIPLMQNILKLKKEL